MDKDFIKITMDSNDIGFASLKKNNNNVLEIYVMGIKKEFHSKGIGKVLIKYIIDYAMMNRYKYLEVKTLDESRESEEYRITRLFYIKVGFLPIDIRNRSRGLESNSHSSGLIQGTFFEDGSTGQRFGCRVLCAEC